MFEHRAGSGGDIVEDRAQPGTTLQPRRGVDGCRQPDCGGSASSTGLGEHRDRGEIVGGPVGEVDDGVVVPHAWWREVPLDLFVEATGTPHRDARGFGDPSPVGDHQLDGGAVEASTARALVRTQRRGPVERGRPAGLHGSPGALAPRRLTGVGDVDARVQRHPFPASSPAGDLHGGHADLERLASRDHAVLQRENFLDRIHVPRSARGSGPSHIAGRSLWMGARNPCRSRLGWIE